MIDLLDHEGEYYTLYRAINGMELCRIKQLEYKAFPKPQNKIIFPSTSEKNIIAAAKSMTSAGFVSKVKVKKSYLKKSNSGIVHSSEGYRDYWISSDDVPNLNNAIIGKIEIIHSFANKEKNHIELYVPIGGMENYLIRQTNNKSFPWRTSHFKLPGSNYTLSSLYPIEDKEYAITLAKTVFAPIKKGGSGFVAAFKINKVFIKECAAVIISDHLHKGYRIPDDRVEIFNKHIIGSIDIIHSYFGDQK